jgi:hypothetical protein
VRQVFRKFGMTPHNPSVSGGGVQLSRSIPDALSSSSRLEKPESRAHHEHCESVLNLESHGFARFKPVVLNTETAERAEIASTATGETAPS